jgi:metallo-beta-lactamase class B
MTPAMKRLTLFLLCFSLPLFAQSDPLSRSWNQPVTPFTIAGNLHYVGASDITSFLITTPEGHIVLDGGFVETAPMIRANVERLGFEVGDVKLLIGSHAHLDHAGGLAELKKVTGATFVSMREEAPLYRAGGKGDRQFGDTLTFPPIEPDRLIADGETVTLGGTSLTAHRTPGHTKGCTTWTATIAKLEVVFLCSPSVPGNYKLDETDIADYRRHFAFLKTLQPDIFLAAHGSFFDLKEKQKTKQFVDPAGYAKFVETMERAFEKAAADPARRRPSRASSAGNMDVRP